VEVKVQEVKEEEEKEKENPTVIHHLKRAKKKNKMVHMDNNEAFDGIQSFLMKDK
jgi:hypothetical protein